MTKENVKKTYTDPKTGKFVKGNPGGGRPPESFSLITILKRELQKCPEGQKKTYADLIVKRMLADAIKQGDDQKIKMMWNYIEGMPKQAIDMTHNIDPFRELLTEIANDKDKFIKEGSSDPRDRSNRGTEEKSQE